MSVREYIGARYIPLFPDDPEWDNTRSYEPLTVVQNLGSSYVSRQFVPIGIDIDNAQYWVHWADFNSQIEQYRQEVATFSGRIDANADDIDELEARLPKSAFTSVSTVRSALDSANSAIASNASGISALDTRVDALEKDYAVFIGDSYLRGTGTEEGPSGGEGFNSLGNGWGKTLAQREGLAASKVMCIGAGGAGFVATGVNGGGLGLNYAGMIQKAAQLMTAEQIARTRYIVILGGINDGSDITVNSISGAFQQCRSLFGSTPIHMFTNMGRNSFPYRPTTGSWAAYALIRERCAGYSASFHETWPLAYGSTGLMATDAIHMTDLGYATLGRAMAAAIHGGEINPFQLGYAGYTDVTPVEGVTFNFPVHFDGRKHVEFSANTIVLDGTVSISGAGLTTLGSIPAVLAPRMMIETVGFWQETGATAFTPLLCRIDSDGSIKVRRGYSVNTTTSVANQPVVMGYTIAAEGRIYFPHVSYDLF